MKEDLEIEDDAVRKIKLVTKDGDVVTDYEDEYFSDDDTPLADLPDTQAAIAKADAETTRELVQKVVEQTQEMQAKTRQGIDELQADISRAEFEKLQKAGDAVHDQESYESYLKERQMLILARAIIEKEEKERLQKSSAAARIKLLAIERQLRDGGTLEDCERTIRLENPGLVNEETMEAMK